MFRDHTKTIRIGDRGHWRREPCSDPVNDEYKDGRRSGYGCPDQPAGRGRMRNYPLCCAQSGGGRSPEGDQKTDLPPFGADIHFDYRLALSAIEAGANKIRINPGNIGSRDRVKAVVDAARERQIPIRVGVNGGSLEKEILEKYHGVTPEGLVESALAQTAMIEEMGYDNLVISIKASDVILCARAHELLAERTSYPLHVGITEAGTVFSGTVKSSVGLGIILYQGIGDTIRVSLTGDPIEEVKAAKAILKDLGLKKGGIQVVSCPTCGRTQIDLIHLANQVEEMVADIPLNLTVAVMGCIVNGPGEAKEADLGNCRREGRRAADQKRKGSPEGSGIRAFVCSAPGASELGKTERAVRIKERIGCKSLFFRFSRRFS